MGGIPGINALIFRLDCSHEIVQVHTWWYNGQKKRKAFDHTCWHAVHAAYEIKIHKQYSKCQHEAIPHFT